MPSAPPLKAGDLLTASGVLIHDHNSLGLYLGHLPVGDGRGLSLDRPGTARLTSTFGSTETFFGALGSTVRVLGEWTGSSIAPSSVDRLESSADCLESSSASHPLVLGVNSAAAPVPFALKEALVRLYRSGDLVAFTTRGDRAFATALNTDRVNRALTKLGLDLTVVASQLSAKRIKDLRALLQGVPNRILFSVGETQSANYQLQLTATVTWVPQSLHDSLTQYPDDSYDVEALLIPLPD